MKRRNRIALLALGAVLVSAIAATFAVSVDTAETGTHRVYTDAEPTQKDLQISEEVFTDSAHTCGGVTYLENQPAATPVIDVTGLQPGDQQQVWLCLRNVGMANTPPRQLEVFDATDLDVDCTNEEDFADATCGGDEAGELSSELKLGVSASAPSVNANCADAAAAGFGSYAVNGIADGVVPFTDGPSTTLANQAICVRITVGYDQALTTNAELQENQSDRVTFRLRFTGAS